ncbi:MAG: hypothetical protein DM484_09770 [Candidatus Methylumidiphilus alinenensis]|uniref:Uncharacterized protein n=1 Tax=Candidatus Methylumidiphilus alinenensis TaxID=2202197 RepID=A0A2W4R8K4_9GAMM|nr:MAG: hypothetical protein DM484_09770 [Candidatus Methylumidiphilus alinenensis]
MLKPDQFKVNEAWIAIKINDKFLCLEDEFYDVYMLMDAASTFVLGHLLSRVDDVTPQEEDVKKIFKDAWGVKRQWPKKLIMPENSVAEDVFKAQAKNKGIKFIAVPLLDLSPIVEPLKQSFASFLHKVLQEKASLVEH